MGCSQSTARTGSGKNGAAPNAAIPDIKVLKVEEQNEQETKKSDSPKPTSVPELKDLVSLGTIHDKYDIDWNVLGEGQFAKVYKCKNKRNGKICAAKMIKKRGTSEERLALEIDILRKVKGHPNVVRLYDVYVTNTEVQLVMEYVAGGELFEHLVEQGPYSEAEAVYQMRRIVSAVDYLHRNGIVHRDLKPENLLLTSKNPRYAEVKVADFGLARIYSENAMQTVCGTWAYCAPEVRNNPKGYTSKVDIWSLGVILYVLLVAYHPFDPKGRATEDELWDNAENGRFNFKDNAWNGVSEEAKDLIKHMMVVDPEQRFSAEDVLSHPWCSGYQHPEVPLSPRINVDLEQVRDKYARRKLGGAGKAVFAHAAFTNLMNKNKKEPVSPPPAPKSEMTETGTAVSST